MPRGIMAAKVSQITMYIYIIDENNLLLVPHRQEEKGDHCRSKSETAVELDAGWYTNEPV